MNFIPTEKLYQKFLDSTLVCTDTRKISKGCIYFALKGDRFDGNAFAEEALRKGAAYAVVDDPKYVSGEQFLYVKDVLQSLQDIALHHRRLLGDKGLRVFALTGSNGKTTTKELIGRVLSQKFNTLITEGNLNNHIGVPLTLLRLNEEHTIAVIEMGANHRGEIQQLCAIAEPDFGLITNIGLAHLEGFGGPEGVFKGKTELFDYLAKKKSTVFVYADDDRLLKYTKNFTRVTYGTSRVSDIQGRIISTGTYLNFSWHKQGHHEHSVKTQLTGNYNLPNLLAAVAIGNYFGVDEEEMKTALSSYSPSNSRSQIEERNTNTLILDCYNANPTSMAAAIENIAGMKSDRKILVLGDMFELGEYSGQEHQSIVDLVSKKTPAATVLLVGKYFGATTDHFGATRLQDAHAAVEWMQKNKPQNSIILIKGSRGMQLENVAAAL